MLRVSLELMNVNTEPVYMKVLGIRDGVLGVHRVRGVQLKV